MARKKTVSISRKPLVRPGAAGDTLPAVCSSAPAGGGPAEPGAGLPRGRPEPRTRSAGPLGRAVYGLAYGLSYGVVFGVILAGKLIPGSGLIGRGFLDGAGAARGYFEAEPNPAGGAETATYAA